METLDGTYGPLEMVVVATGTRYILLEGAHSALEHQNNCGSSYVLVILVMGDANPYGFEKIITAFVIVRLYQYWAIAEAVRLASTPQIMQK